MKKGIKQLAAILILAGLSLTGGMSFAVEWEMMDRFSVDGYSEFRGTVAVPSGGFTVGGSTFAVQYGKIGIGTSTPSFLLHISTAAGVAGDLVVISTGDINVIRMTGAGEIYANKFNGDGSGLGMVVASSVAASGVRPGSIMPDVIVDADINTSAAILPTKIYGTAAVLGANTFTSSQTITGAGGLLATYGVSAATAAFTAQDASVPGVTISSGLIVSSGSVGIGTSSPSGKLSVKPAASDAFSLFISSQDGTTGNLVVAKSGYVGVGTTGPGQKLTIQDTSAAPYLSLISADTAPNGILFGKVSRTNSGQIYYNNSTDAMTFASNSAIAMTISSAGSIGVGTINPAAIFDVGGTTAMKIPVGTTAERPASPANGMVRVNTTTGKLEYYNSGWYGVGAMAAAGGTVTDIGGYRIHTFTTGTADKTFTVTAGGSIDYLVVGGGGSGGGNEGGGGGGAGGVLSGSINIIPGSYTIAVGAYGPSTGNSTSRGVNGGNSGIAEPAFLSPR